MNNDALKPLINRIDGLENQINTIEEKRREESRGPMARIRDMALIVALIGGVIGGVGGSITLWEKWEERHAMPNIEASLGQNLELSLRPDRQLDLKSGLTLDNHGNAKDVVTKARAYLTYDASGAQERVPLENIRFSEKGAPITLTFTVGAGGTRDLEITAGSALTPDKERKFLETIPRTLVLIFDFKESQESRQVTRCFWPEELSVKTLREKGSTRFFDLDERCQLGAQ